MQEESIFQPEDVTLYVPCYRVEETIVACLQGLLAQTCTPGRILLLDDGSPVPVQIPAELKCPRVDLLRDPVNKGLAAVRNRALQECRTRLIGSVDADVVADPQWLEQLLAALNETQAAGVGGRLDEHYQDSLGDRWRAVHMAQHWGDQRVINPRFLYGANTLFRTDVLRENGGYNSKLRTNYEDMSLSELLYERGLTLCYEPRAKCRHLRRDSEKTILRGFWQWYHAKGVLAGEFSTPQGLINRIGQVNFGIGRYRYDMDLKASRTDLLVLDRLIPWVFCAHDLALAQRLSGFDLPMFPSPALSAKLPAELVTLVNSMLPEAEVSGTALEWHGTYLSTFASELESLLNPW